MKPTGYIDSLKIAFTCSGTFIGAGFASGQEFLQFFIAYGQTAIISLLLAGILFYLFSRRLLHLSYKHHLSSQTALMKYLFSPTIAVCMDFMLSLFLFAVLIIMLAAAGTLAFDTFYIEPQYGSLTLLIIIIAAAWRGFGGIAKINLFVTPLLITAILLVSIHSLAYHGIVNIPDPKPYYAYQAAPTWLLGSLLYVSYNLILSITILAPLGSKATAYRVLSRGSAISSLILTTLSILIATALLSHCPDILTSPLPMLEISCSQTTLHTILYSGTLIFATFTTSLSCLYGCAMKCANVLPCRYTTNLFLVGATALGFAPIGFSQLIALLFPLFGLLGFAVLYKLIAINKAI